MKNLYYEPKNAMTGSHNEKGSGWNSLVLESKPPGKRPRGKPRKRWIDEVEKDPRSWGLETVSER